MAMPLATGLVEPGSRTWYALNSTCGEDSELSEALRLVEFDAANFAQRFIQDSIVRANYISRAQQFSQELGQKVLAGELTAEQAFREAHAMRNSLLEASRLHSSDIGRAVAHAEKASGVTCEELLARYADRLFKQPFRDLSAAQQDAVFMEIVRAAGTPNPRFNALAMRLGTVGRGLLVVSIAFAVYDIASSDRPGRETARQAVGLGVGFLGSVAGGAAAGLVCGPGAPVCVTIGVFAGGLAFAVGADLTFDWLWE
jgi:hypothetical protein